MRGKVFIFFLSMMEHNLHIDIQKYESIKNESSDKIPLRFIGCWFDDPKIDERTRDGDT